MYSMSNTKMYAPNHINISMLHVCLIKDLSLKFLFYSITIKLNYLMTKTIKITLILN